MTKNSNQKRFFLFKGLAILGFLLPLLVLFFVEPSYFIKRPSFSVGVGGVTALIIALIVLKNKLKEWVGKNPILFSMLIFSVVVTFLRDSLEMLPLIGWFSVVGILICEVFDRVAEVYYSSAYRKINGKIKTEKKTDLIPVKTAFRVAFGFTVDESILASLETEKEVK